MSPHQKKIKVCVFCGSKMGKEPIFAEKAAELGKYLGTHNFDLVFGGGNTGLMGVVSQNALKSGSYVTGIIPEILLNVERPKDNLSECVIVKDMHERKRRMTELADIFVVLPGGIGTYEEAFEVLTGKWIGAHSKPLGFLDIDNYYRELMNFISTANQKGFIPDACRELIFSHSDPAILINELLSRRKAG